MILPEENKSCFADVILPLALNKLLTYAVPSDLQKKVQSGVCVKVIVGKKKYTALVRRVHSTRPEGYAVKEILEVVNEKPIVNEKQFLHWEQIANYYLCSVGEVMKSALPNSFRTIFRPLTETFVRLHSSISSEEKLHEVLNSLKRAAKQEVLLSAYLSLVEKIDYSKPHEISKKQLLQIASQSAAVFTACEKKNIFEIIVREIGRLDFSAIAGKTLPELSAAQMAAREKIAAHFVEKKVALLHGVTASGKTEIYIDLIAEQIRKGKQVLYLLPEIALTTQIVERLQSVFGNIVGVYHSKYNDNERAEIYNAVPYQIGRASCRERV